MSEPREFDSRAMTPEETALILRRILDAVDGDRRGRRTEVACAVVLAMATTASAWCAYQASRWGGVETFQLAVAAKAGREAAQHSLANIQTRAFDAQMLFVFLDARSRGDDKESKFIRERFRPEARKALEAWLLTRPFDDPAAPKHPFVMKEYLQPELEQANRCEAQSVQSLSAADAAGQSGDRFVLLTVLFATVLFFGGIGGTLRGHRLRFIFLAISVLLFGLTLAAMVNVPVCRD